MMKKDDFVKVWDSCLQISKIERVIKIKDGLVYSERENPLGLDIRITEINRCKKINCMTCYDEKWVCESHPDKPWNKNISGGCECNAGMPCASCMV